MSEEQGVPAVGFLVMAFTDETSGDDALKAMKDAKKQGQFYYEDAAVIKQDADGKVDYHETGDMSTGKGAGVGALVGGIIGILGGPAGIVLGAGAGAAVGAALAHGDAGFNDENLETIGVALKPGTSAVAAITSHDFLKAIQDNVDEADILTAVRNLSAEISDRLAEGKSMALGLVLAEDRLVFKEVAFDDESTEVIGAVLTADGLVAGAAVATADGVTYQVGVATDEGTAVESGVVTEDGSVVVDDVVSDEGEVVAVDAEAPVEVADEATDVLVEEDE